MTNKKKSCAALPVLMLMLCLSGCLFPKPETPPEATEPPKTVGVLYGVEPEELTTSRLYERAADGSMVPVLAASEPADVTAEYAGAFGIPGDAERGYAFRIPLNEHARWEDGEAVTAAGFVHSLEALLKSGETDWYFIANARSYGEGTLTGGEEVISLAQAGIGSVSDAREEGYREFYLDAGTFWALEAQWLPVNETLRLRDWAMAPGLDEQYVSAAYLYETYLAEGQEYDYLQTEFVGIAADARPMTMEDVGFFQTEDYTLTVILEEPAAAETVMLKMAELALMDDRSCGPYRVVSVSDAYTELLPNENWWGERDYDVDILRIR